MNIPTFGFWLFDELAPMIGWEKPSIHLTTPNYGSFKVKTSSIRLECLVRNSKCVKCGLAGGVWLLQAHHCYIKDGQVQLRETPHLNLYAVNDDDKLILMTRDHIIPRARGGMDLMENLQTMCAPCNNAKADSLTQMKEILSHYRATHNLL
jgi:5-methylcytosine-specific restriction endonuclease McrA